MTKSKSNNSNFYFTKSEEEYIEYINKVLPIKISNLESIIDKIHIRYPLVDKVSIALTVKATLETIRELLIKGKVLNFNNVFYGLRFLFFFNKKYDAILPRVKVKISVSPKLRK